MRGSMDHNYISFSQKQAPTMGEISTDKKNTPLDLQWQPCTSIKPIKKKKIMEA
jgi:hypothetical protein